MSRAARGRLAAGAVMIAAVAAPAGSSAQTAPAADTAQTTVPATATTPTTPVSPPSHEPPREPVEPQHEEPARPHRPAHEEPHGHPHRPAARPRHEHRKHGKSPHKRSKHHKAKRHHRHQPAEPAAAAVPGALDNVPAASVPALAIDNFRIPVFLLPIYQAAGIQYGVRWEVLAAINEIETDYGRNSSVSSAGALGWMQFMPATWKLWGVDGNHDGRRDPQNPVDAIFSAARYLSAAGASDDLRGAIFAYNHADWYVDSVLLRARLIAGYPPALVDALTGLGDGRFPVAAPARYRRRSATGKLIFTRRDAPVVAVSDGVVRRIGWSAKRGRYVQLQDVYGNLYTYSELGSVPELYPVPRRRPVAKRAPAAVTARLPFAAPAATVEPQASGPAPRPQPRAVEKTRLFAHPQRPASRRHGGIDQILRGGSDAPGFERYSHVLAPALGLDAKHATLRRLRPGVHVVRGTVIGRVGRVRQLRFELRPAGRGAPLIDPTPILDGWRLLESTAVYRSTAASTRSPLSIGQAMLLPKPALERRVLGDRRIAIYPAGRRDIGTGQIDRRVLATLEYLAESGLRPTVTCLRAGHSLLTASGNVSEHSTGDAADIGAINGVPIEGHQQPGGVADQVVRRLMLLQGPLRPHQIISLLDLGANTLALADHGNHVHVGFRPAFSGDPAAASVLAGDQWSRLTARLGTIDQPAVRTRPSRWALR